MALKIWTLQYSIPQAGPGFCTMDIGQVHYVGNWHGEKEFADINHLPGSIKYFASLIQLLSLDRDDSILLFLKFHKKLKVNLGTNLQHEI